LAIENEIELITKRFSQNRSSVFVQGLPGKGQGRPGHRPDTKGRLQLRWKRLPRLERCTV